MKIGDWITLVDEDLKAKIIAKKGEVLTVEDEYGFEQQFFTTEVIKIEPTLYDQTPIITKKEPEKKVSKKNKREILALDLHFDKLVDNPLEYSSWERLFIQKQKLQDTLDFCRQHRIRELEVIHGIGDGVLQEMVLEVLKGQMDVEYEEGNFFKHHTGSIMVRIKK